MKQVEFNGVSSNWDTEWKVACWHIDPEENESFGIAVSGSVSWMILVMIAGRWSSGKMRSTFIDRIRVMGWVKNSLPGGALVIDSIVALFPAHAKSTLGSVPKHSWFPNRLHNDSTHIIGILRSLIQYLTNATIPLIQHTEHLNISICS